MRMSAAASGGAAAAAAAAARIQALKASGVIVRVEPAAFLALLTMQKEPLVVHASGGVFWTTYKYLVSYKGLAFFTESEAALNLPEGTEMVMAQSIWIPG
jgi:hypothetical protein